MVRFNEIPIKDLKEIYDRLSAFQYKLNTRGNMVKMCERTAYTVVGRYDNGGWILELDLWYCSLTVRIDVLDYRITRIALFCPNYSIAMKYGDFIKLDYDKFCYKLAQLIRSKIKRLDTKWNKTKDRIEELESKANIIMEEMETLENEPILRYYK